MTKRCLPVMLLMVQLALVSGCGLLDYYLLPPPEDTAQELFEAGLDAMKSKDYGDAADYFNKLKDRFPFSPYTLKAELALGDAYYLDKKYPEAADTYREFESMHPAHKEIAYVLFQIGMSSYKQFRSIDRKQDNIKLALEYFYRVEQGYPKTKYAKEARKYIMNSRIILAKHELYTADLYYRLDRFGAAWQRYKYVVENFPDVPELQKFARKRAQESYYEYQKTLSDNERMRLQDSWLLWLKNWL